MTYFEMVLFNCTEQKLIIIYIQAFMYLFHNSSRTHCYTYKTRE